MERRHGARKTRLQVDFLRVIDMCAAPPASALEEEEDDALEVFSSSLHSLFDHVVPAAGDPLQLYTYSPPNGPPLTCRIPPQQVNQLFAHHVWNSSLRLADAISLGRIEGLDDENATILELGAGAGIPGLIAARRPVKRVVLSDYDDPLLIDNLESNISLAYPSDEAARKRIRAVGHTWGESESLAALLAANSSGPFTHILLADTLWASSSHDLLLSSLPLLLARTPSSRIHITAGFHSGRATVRSFLRKARLKGFVPKGEWAEVGVKGERRAWGWDLEDGAKEGEEGEWVEKEEASERNKWLVEGALGWGEGYVD
ncbi:SPOSA6832_05088 [Sporobolomyces salmonicolor]|uniref:SPOSA6832_05088-mRNA-1:cds n=1 Tax=Sporidiobolus salmonicolor TaxID=5005 RepID=A0A0D6ETN3_SPOSA|nr:SPOSA6832_05088 [Sporobolomyces salmonicolor]